MKKVIIGIVSKNITIQDFYNWSWQRISNSIRCAINKNKGLVLGILPQTTRQNFNLVDEHEDVILTSKEKKDLIFFIKKCDGIILQGGISSHNYEEFIAKYCYEHDLPLLGICAGFNNVIKGLGGKTDILDNPNVHDRPDLTYAHKCIITDKNSLFYKIVKHEVFDVNSIHTYLATLVPKELSIVAVSEDKQIEVVEAKNKRFYIGIKYHPELLVDFDEKQNRIFKKFIQICGKK